MALDAAGHVVRSPAADLEIPIQTLEEFVAARGIAPDTLEIDVEGMEYEVLDGARQTLERHSPLVFL
ncbi:MAG TPA: FkbM family methyltransferase [Solirubrobacteraceae bacterium]|jgi:FkbM family methyltransferase|nr:FkbM family methyltransferase [Solirubrobacteraceae bacterium]